MYLFRRGDWFSVLALAAVLLLLSFFRFVPWREKGYTLIVEGNGKTEEYQISSDLSLSLEVSGPLGVTLVRVQDGQSWIAHSPCLDKQCLAAGKIPDDTDFIACEANGVSLRIQNKEEWSVLPLVNPDNSLYNRVRGRK